MPALHRVDGQHLVQLLRREARSLGFSQIGFTGIDLADAEPGLRAWLDAGFHGGMQWMARHGTLRARPAELVEGTVTVISARMPYLPREPGPSLEPGLTLEVGASRQPAAPAEARAGQAWRDAEHAALRDDGRAVVSVYARGRDYHKVLRQRLQRLAARLAAEVGPFGHRAFTDSAPVMEAELAVRAGLGWRGKHTLVLDRDGGSMFFLGELFVDLALPHDDAVGAHCGSCTACLDVCPTRAIVAPYRLDARRCISYLTIEHDGAIDPALRPLVGNRIYGCDDCQLACPWNRFAARSPLPDFDVREGFAGATLAALWAWDEDEFLRRTEGSAIRRIGWRRWRRNLAVALGNAWRGSGDAALARALQAALPAADALVAEHVRWALAQRTAPTPGGAVGVDFAGHAGGVAAVTSTSTATPPATAAAPPSPAASTP